MSTVEIRDLHGNNYSTSTSISRSIMIRFVKRWSITSFHQSLLISTSSSLLLHHNILNDVSSSYRQLIILLWIIIVKQHLRRSKSWTDQSEPRIFLCLPMVTLHSLFYGLFLKLKIVHYKIQILVIFWADKM